MNRRIKRMAFVTALMFVLTIFASCGASSEEELPAPSPEAQRTQFEQTAQTRVVEEAEGITNTNLLETTGDMLVSADCPKVSQSEAISTQLQEYVSQSVDSFKSEAGSMGAPDEHSELYHYMLTYKPYKIGDDLLGIKFTETAYSGKTDRKNHIETFVYNLGTSQDVGPNDVFDTAQNYLETLADIVRGYLQRNQVLQQHLDQTLFDQGTAPTIQNYSNFVLADDARILFYFNPGSIAPADAGSFEVSVPLAQIDTILNPQNKTALYGKSGAMQPSTDAENDEQVADVLPTDDGRARLEELGIVPLPQLYKGDEYMQPQDTTGIDPLEDKVVALTFDDGPSAYTEELLNVLKENDVNATFFLVGENAERNPEVIKRMYEEGNEIGGHSWDHSSNFKNWTLDEVNKQIEDTNQTIQEATGKKPFMDRPPEGAITEEIAEQIGREQIMWDVDPEDWVEANRDPDTVYDHVVNSDNLRDGSIILLHDIRETSVQAVDRIIKELKAQDYTFVTVSQMIQIAQMRGKDDIGFVFNSAPTAESAKELDAENADVQDQTDDSSGDSSSSGSGDSGSSGSGGSSSGGNGSSSGSGDSGNGGSSGNNGGDTGNGGDSGSSDDDIVEQPSEGGSGDDD